MLSFLICKNSGNVSENWNSVFYKRGAPTKIVYTKGIREDMFIKTHFQILEYFYLLLRGRVELRIFSLASSTIVSI